MTYRCLCLLTLLLVAGVASAQVKINEFDSGTPDAIELINRSFTPTDVSGWTVATYYRTTGTGAMTVETPYVLPPGTVIPAGGFLVIQENGTPGLPGTLPSSISSGINYQWANTRSIAVALLDNTSAGVDYVFANRGGGGAVAPNLPAGTTWTGTLAPTGDNVWRNTNVDTDDAADWSVVPGNTFGAVNPGQTINDPVLLTLTTTGVGDVSIAVTTMPALPNRTLYNLFSLVNFTPNGTGPFFGVGLDVLPQLQFGVPPFTTTTDATGSYSVSFPANSIPLGLYFEGVAIVVNGASVLVSPVDDVQF